MRQDTAIKLINTLLTHTKDIKNGNHDRVHEYSSTLKLLVKLNLEKSELVVIKNKFVGAKALMPFLENLSEQKTVSDILEYLKKFT